MTFVNQRTRYCSGGPELIVDEVRKLLADVRDEDAMVSYGMKTGEDVTDMIPWMTVKELRDAIASTPGDYAVKPGGPSFTGDPLTGDQAILEIVQEDVFGQVVHLTDDEARRRGFSKKAIARAHRENGDLY